jgi:hypothetical protein
VTLTGTTVVLRWGCFIDAGQLGTLSAQRVTVTIIVEKTVDVIVSIGAAPAGVIVGSAVAVGWEPSVSATGQMVVATMMVSVVT